MDKATATFGTGCFWCTEAIFKELEGVEEVIPGYAGGKTTNPTYEEVCRGQTGHAEVIQIVFNPKFTSYQDLLEVFWSVHDPTSLNRQGGDVGQQYKSVIFYHNDQQKGLAEDSKKEAQKLFKDPIVTQIVPLTNFYPAEDYHKNYFEKNPQAPYCQLVINPKLSHFREKFKDKLLKQLT